MTGKSNIFNQTKDALSIKMKNLLT